jgi:hypothetical protein
MAGLLSSDGKSMQPPIQTSPSERLPFPVTRVRSLSGVKAITSRRTTSLPPSILPAPPCPTASHAMCGLVWALAPHTVSPQNKLISQTWSPGPLGGALVTCLTPLVNGDTSDDEDRDGEAQEDGRPMTPPYPPPMAGFDFSVDYRHHLTSADSATYVNMLVHVTSPGRRACAEKAKRKQWALVQLLPSSLRSL